jgi:hypothetical protein
MPEHQILLSDRSSAEVQSVDHMIQEYDAALIFARHGDPGVALARFRIGFMSGFSSDVYSHAYVLTELMNAAQSALESAYASAEQELATIYSGALESDGTDARDAIAIQSMVTELVWDLRCLFQQAVSLATASQVVRQMCTNDCIEDRILVWLEDEFTASNVAF